MTKSQIEKGAIPAVQTILDRYKVKNAEMISEVVVDAVIGVIRELKEAEARHAR